MKNTAPWRTGCRRLALQALAAVGAAFVWATPVHASASLFMNTGTVCTVTSPCWQAGDFGVLVGLRNASNQWVTNTVNFTESGAVGADVNGEIGVGAGSKLVFSSGTTNRTWDGPIDFADSLTSTSGYCGVSGTTACGVPTGTTLTRTQGSNTGTVRVDRGTFHLPNHVQTAMEQMRDISAYWAGQTGTTVTNLGSGTNSFSGTGTKVYTVASNSLISTNTAITLTGDSTSLFIFNILSSTSTGTIPVQLKNNIVLNGINADQVFFNILGSATGSATFVLSASAGNLNGVFYVANDAYSANTTFQSARLMGGTNTSAWGANFLLNAPSDVPVAPEPSTYVLMISGLGGFLYARKRRMKALRSSTPVPANPDAPV